MNQHLKHLYHKFINTSQSAMTFQIHLVSIMSGYLQDLRLRVRITYECGDTYLYDRSFRGYHNGKYCDWYEIEPSYQKRQPQ